VGLSAAEAETTASAGTLQKDASHGGRIYFFRPERGLKVAEARQRLP
jgi:hypothetical protein